MTEAGHIGLNEVALGIPVPDFWAQNMVRTIGAPAALLQDFTLTAIEIRWLNTGAKSMVGTCFLFCRPSQAWSCHVHFQCRSMQALPEALRPFYATCAGAGRAGPLLQFAKLAAPQEALQLGLVDHVVPMPQLLPTAEATIKQVRSIYAVHLSGLALSMLVCCVGGCDSHQVAAWPTQEAYLDSGVQAIVD